MNKISKLTTIFLAVTFLFSSCQNFLDTDSVSTFDESIIFSDPALADGALLGAYHVLGIHGSYRNRLMHLFANADTEMSNSGLATLVAGAGRRGMSIYNVSAGQAETGASFQGVPHTIFCFAYMAIERLNIVINGIRTFGDLNNRSLAHIYGEALALRAFFYFDLIRWHGDVPARFEPVTSATIFVPRADRDIIYRQILDDLAVAAEHLPWPGEALMPHKNRIDRMNQAFARAFRARVALFAGGYSLRNDDGQPVMRRSDPASPYYLNRREMYEIARYETSRVMENVGRGFRLENSFEQIFIDNMREVVSTGRETIFELPFNPNNRGEWASFFGTSHVSPGDMFSHRGRAETGPTPIMWYWFNDRDIRRDVSIVHHIYEAATPTTAMPVIQRSENTPNIRNAYFGKLRHSWGIRRIATNDDGIKPIVMRYSDVLLMFAEADNFLSGGPTDAARDALRQVRRRAFAPEDWSEHVDTYIATVSASEVRFLQAIMDERAFEFLGEQRRKYDLIRWNRLRAHLEWAQRQMERMRDGSAFSASIPTPFLDALPNPPADIDFSEFPRHIFWRHLPPVGGLTPLEIFGLRKGEFPRDANDNIILIEVAANGQPSADFAALDVWAETFDGGGWNRYVGTASGTNPPNPLEWIDRRNQADGNPLSDAFIRALFQNCPNERSLFPIWTVPINNSQGHMTNFPWFD